MKEYLKASEVIDWQHPDLLECARQIAGDSKTPIAIAQACFDWVRDEIHHSYDYRINPVTCRS